MADKKTGKENSKRRSDGRLTRTFNRKDGTRKFVYGKSEREVQIKLKQAKFEAETANEDRETVSDQSLTFAQYSAMWLEGRRAAGLEIATLTGYDSHLRVHLLPAFESTNLKEITPMRVQTFMSDLSIKKKLSSTTVHHVLTTLNTILTDAYHLEIIARNPAEHIRKPALKSKPQQTFDAEQLRIFMNAIRGDRLEALYLLAITTSKRESEILGLSWDGVRLDERLITITQKLGLRQRQLYISKPKTDATRRTLPILPMVADALQQHRARQQEEEKAAQSAWNNAWNLVFTNEVGQPIRYYNLIHYFHTILRKAGLPEIRFHDLRHTIATLLIETGVPIKVVSELLGHSTVRTTLDIYAHVQPVMVQQALVTMENILSSPTGSTMPLTLPLPTRYLPLLTAMSKRLGKTLHQTLVMLLEQTLEHEGQKE